MNPLTAIAKLTLQTCLRNYVFQLLFLLLILGNAALIFTISGDGTVTGEIQILIAYPLFYTITILSAVSLWLGCTNTAADIEACHIQLVATKPVASSTYWLGKWLGIMAVQTVLLVVSAMAIYFLIMKRIDSSHYNDSEIDKIKDEILVGRRVFFPKFPDSGTGINAAIVRVNSGITWDFSGLPNLSPEDSMNLRYRMYLDNAMMSGQRETRGLWWIENPEDNQAYRLTKEVVAGVYEEISISAKVIGKSGKLALSYENRDPNLNSVVFQSVDGPFLFFKKTDFKHNYCRAILVVYFHLLFLVALGCTCGVLLSAPMAIFMAFSYVSMGVLLSFLSVVFTGTSQEIPGHFLLDISRFVYRALETVTVPLTELHEMNRLINGELIEVKRLTELFNQILILHGIPIGLLGMWLLSKRELGIASRR